MRNRWKRICRRRSIGRSCRLCSSLWYFGSVVSIKEKRKKEVYKGDGRDFFLRWGEMLTQRMSRRCCCSLRFCMCSCKNRITLVGIGRLYDRSWCGHSIGHRPLGNGGLVFNFFICPAVSGQKVGSGVAYLVRISKMKRHLCSHLSWLLCQRKCPFPV